MLTRLNQQFLKHSDTPAHAHCKQSHTFTGSAVGSLKGVVLVPAACVHRVYHCDRFKQEVLVQARRHTPAAVHVALMQEKHAKQENSDNFLLHAQQLWPGQWLPSWTWLPLNKRPASGCLTIT